MEAAFHIAVHKHEGTTMTIKILSLMDRAAMSLINALVVAGLPLVAVGMLTNSI